MRLGIGLETVRTYWSRIKEKLAVETRSEAVIACSNRDVANIVRAHESENRILLDEIRRRRTAEKLLSESEARFKFFCEISSQGVFLTDPRGRCSFVNKECLRCLGVPETLALGMNWLALPWDPKMRNRIRRARVDLGKRGAHQSTYRLLVGGKMRDIRISVRSVNHGFGLAGYIGTVEDISESIRLKADIAEARQLCQCVSAATEDIVYVYELSTGTVLSVNHVSEKLFGMTSDEICSLGAGSLLKCIDPGDHQQLAEMQERYYTLADGEAITIRCRAIAADGSRPMLEGRIVVYKRDDLGMPEKMVGVLKILNSDKGM